MTEDPERPPSEPPAGLTGPVGRVVAVLLGLVMALVGGLVRALVEGFTKALGAGPDEPPDAEGRS